MAKSPETLPDDRTRLSTDQLGALSRDEQFALKEGDVVHTLHGRRGALRSLARPEFSTPPLAPAMIATMTAVDFGPLRGFGPVTPV